MTTQSHAKDTLTRWQLAGGYSKDAIESILDDVHADMQASEGDRDEPTHATIFGFRAVVRDAVVPADPAPLGDLWLDYHAAFDHFQMVLTDDSPDIILNTAQARFLHRELGRMLAIKDGAK